MKRFIGMVLILLLATSTLQIYAQDTDENQPFPPPTGPYQVGVTFREWVDETREEPFTADTSDKRLFSMWIYYPADVEDGAEAMPYVMDDTLLPSLQFQVEGRFEQDYEEMLAILSQWTSYAYQDAPISDEQESYPVILFVSANFSPLAESLQAVELASQGYVVITLLHFPDGILQFTDQGSFILPDALITFPEFVELSVLDMTSLLDMLHTDDRTDHLMAKLDLNSIGIHGMTIGGGVAREAAVRDSRITAGVSLGGGFGDYETTPPVQPFMYLYHDQRYDPAEYYTASAMPAYLIHIDALNTFQDWMFYPGREHLIPETMTAARAYEVYMHYVVAFFDEYLKGEDQPLLDGVSDDFPEVTAFEALNIG